MKKFRLLSLFLLALLVMLGAVWLRQFLAEDACYDGGGYMEKGQCVTADSCRAAGGSVQTGRCVGARPAH